MDYRVLIDKLFAKGNEKFESMEVYIENSKEIAIEVFQGEVDKYSISESGGLSLRGFANDKMGYSYTEKIDESSIDMLINEAYENGTFIESKEVEEIFKGSEDYETIDNYSETLTNTPIEEKIELVKNLEREALSLDKRVVSVQVCGYQEFAQSRYIKNTKGVDLKDRINGGVAYVSVVVKEGEDTKTGLSYRNIFDFKELDYKEIAKEAVDEAISLLGASPIKTGDYPMIIKNKVFGDILDFTSSIYSAENIDKGLSLLKDKIGEKVASDILTICDDPFLKDGFGSRGFDDEGMKTSTKKIIDKGVLTCYLHSLKTAKKFKAEPTGNSKRSSYKSPLAIAPTNFYVEKGDMSLEEMISTIDKGIYIISVAGLHSGLNPVSGDFSLLAHGYEIEDGKILRPINQITIAGNLYEVFKDIEIIGNDLSFGFPSGSYYGSPSIKIKSISVAGDK